MFKPWGGLAVSVGQVEPPHHAERGVRSPGFQGVACKSGRTRAQDEEHAAEPIVASRGYITKRPQAARCAASTESARVRTPDRQ